MSVVLALLLVTSPVEVISLDPSTTLVLVEDHRAPTVELRLEVPVGRWSPWLREEQGEVAWEALLLDPERTLLLRADALAAAVDTSVGTRACTLRASFLREDLPAVVELLRDALRGHRNDRGELKRRARARRLGWSLSMKDPSFVLARTAAAVLFAEDDPRRRVYQRPSASVPSEKALRAVQERMLALPGRMVGLAGDVDRDTAEEVARRLFGPADLVVPEGIAPALLAPVPLAERKDATETLPRLTQVYVADVRLSVPVSHEDAPALAIADHVLGGHFYSRLYTALRHQGGETYGASTWSGVESVETLYGTSTFTRTDNAAVTERKLAGVLRTFHEAGIIEEERAAAAGYLRGRLPFLRQSPARILERALFERRLGLPPGELDALVDRAEATSLEEVNAFIRRFYDPATFRRVRIGDRHQ